MPSSASFSSASGWIANPSTLTLVCSTVLISSLAYGSVLTIMHRSSKSIGTPCGDTIPSPPP